MTDAVLKALADTLARDPLNGPLWLHYGQMLAAGPRAADAMSALRKALELGEHPPVVLQDMLPLLRDAGLEAEALIRAEACVADHEAPAIRLMLAEILRAKGEHAVAAAHYRAARDGDARLEDDDWEDFAADQPIELVRASAGAVEAPPPAEWVDRFAEETPSLSFADVAGLADVKQQINLRIVAPFKTPEIFKAFKRQAGGGLLLYGPPGCGKTFVARATAGEVGARFIPIGIADLVDSHWGESEKAIRALFADARARTPAVLFFDEFDALGAARGGTESQFWRALVTQLLNEMDGIDGPNAGVLVLAATNLPWAVDAAFRRPGRFDRVVFVPPPDEPARAAMLKTHAAELPGGETLDVAALARKTAGWSGADLKALCERAAEGALERSLASGKIQPVSVADFTQAVAASRPSTAEWFASARNHVKYANEGGRYDDLAAYMKANRLG